MKPTGKQQGENQNQPDARSLHSLNTRNPKNSNLGTRVKPESKDDAEGIHLPGPINDPEQLLKDTSQEASPLKSEVVLDLTLLGVEATPLLALLQDDPEALHELVQDPTVSDAENDEKGGTDAGAYDVSHTSKAIKPIPQSTTGSGNNNTSNNDNSAVPQREEGPHSGRPLPGSDEPPGHEVDGGDVVGVQGMAQAEDVREGGGRDEAGVEVQHDGSDGPYDGVDADEEEDHEQAVCGDAAEEAGLGDAQRVSKVEGCHGDGE